jgi:hypothetical protein
VTEPPGRAPSRVAPPARRDSRPPSGLAMTSPVASSGTREISLSLRRRSGSADTDVALRAVSLSVSGASSRRTAGATRPRPRRPAREEAARIRCSRSREIASVTAACNAEEAGALNCRAPSAASAGSGSAVDREPRSLAGCSRSTSTARSTWSARVGALGLDPAQDVPCVEGGRPVGLDMPDRESECLARPWRELGQTVERVLGTRSAATAARTSATRRTACSSDLRMSRPGRRVRLEGLVGASAEDEVGRLLADHDRRRVGVPGRHGRHHRRVRNPQILQPVHAQVRVDDRE